MAEAAIAINLAYAEFKRKRELGSLLAAFEKYNTSVPPEFILNDPRYPESIHGDDIPGRSFCENRKCSLCLNSLPIWDAVMSRDILYLEAIRAKVFGQYDASWDALQLIPFRNETHAPVSNICAGRLLCKVMNQDVCPNWLRTAWVNINNMAKRLLYYCLYHIYLNSYDKTLAKAGVIISLFSLAAVTILDHHLLGDFDFVNDYHKSLSWLIFGTLFIFASFTLFLWWRWLPFAARIKCLGIKLSKVISLKGPSGLQGIASGLKAASPRTPPST